MQVCPVAAKTPAMTPLTALEMSASSKTICGDFPPSSSDTRAPRAAAVAPMRSPVAVEPVKAILSTPGWSTSAAPVGPRPVMTLNTPLGTPASTASSASRMRRRRRDLGRLGDDGVARGERGEQLPAQEPERRVPGRDRGDDAERLAHRVGREVREGRAHGVAVQLLGQARVEVAVAGHRPDVRAHLADELAVLADLLVHEAIRVLLDEQAQPAQDGRARRGRLVAPVGLLERAARGPDGLVDLLGRRDGDLTPGDGGERIDAAERAAVGARHPLAVDQHPVLAVEVVGAGVARRGGACLDGHARGLLHRGRDCSQPIG